MGSIPKRGIFIMRNIICLIAGSGAISMGGTILLLGAMGVFPVITNPISVGCIFAVLGIIIQLQTYTLINNQQSKK